ncbi:HAD superfamily hydrolase [Weissella oryzae SG25]|uniref:HAD superfamily hydrolase n=1 Tax=Weissella oryzae (strain DSM 25784 / JCM 18191 / LMG 30913 / SG25) TaxID=1329250 RepID=A0A069CU50_WEIOS|nr:Cof-type HAD-IIB family hydrolase [Weissella oryzae]GAK30922.1 HAD superfamily hydrolase [Weissella oryzae SG25]
MTIKLVTIDIDDTLVNSAREITPRVKAAIQAATAAGVKIVLATGRPLTGVVDYLDELGLNNQDDQFVINYNGGMIQTTSGKVLGGGKLDLAAYQELRQVADDLNVYMQVEADDAAYTSDNVVPYHASRENFIVKMPLKFVPLAEMPADLPYIKVMMIGDAAKIDADTAALPQAIQDKYYVVRSTANFLEFMNPKASKGAALELLAKHLNLSMDETMALGDQENDLTMIKAAGLGVAMGNAVEKVKKTANMQTTSQNADGVGLAIEKWVLGKNVPELN